MNALKISLPDPLRLTVKTNANDWRGCQDATPVGDWEDRLEIPYCVGRTLDFAKKAAGRSACSTPLSRKEQACN
jgi:hypothetical protein